MDRRPRQDLCRLCPHVVVVVGLVCFEGPWCRVTAMRSSHSCLTGPRWNSRPSRTRGLRRVRTGFFQIFPAGPKKPRQHCGESLDARDIGRVTLGTNWGGLCSAVDGNRLIWRWWCCFLLLCRYLFLPAVLHTTWVLLVVAWSYIAFFDNRTIQHKKILRLARSNKQTNSSVLYYWYRLLALPTASSAKMLSPFPEWWLSQNSSKTVMQLRCEALNLALFKHLMRITYSQSFILKGVSTPILMKINTTYYIT